MIEELEEISTRYIGERVRLIWSSFSDEQKQAMIEDANKQALTDWSDSIDAMGEDA